MLSVILFILKLIGILLAFIVGLVILLLLLVLLVPIRYKVYARYEEDIFGEVKVHWLLKMIHFHAYYMDDKMRMRLRLFGFVIYDPDRVKKKKNNNRNKTKNKRDNKSNKISKKTKPKAKKGLSKNTNKNDKASIAVENQSNQKNNNRKTEKDEIIASTPKANNDITRANNDIGKANSDIDKANRDIGIPEASIEKANVNKDKPMGETEKSDTSIKKTNSKLEKPISDIDDKAKVNNEAKSQSKIVKIYTKIKTFFIHVIEAPSKVKQFAYSFIDKMKKRINRLNEIINKGKAFIKDEINKDGFLNIFGGIGQILKHIKPRKLVIRIELGMDDPALTGMALGLLSIIIGLHGEHVTITPNFNDKVFKANLLAIGRLRTIRLLIIGIKLALYKNNKQLFNNIKVFKEEI